MILLDHATSAITTRFMRQVDQLPCGCWFWTGCRSRGSGNRKWYGTFYVSKEVGRVRAHRFACEVVGERGPLPRGHHRDHSCCFSLCVNPAHIDYVTHERNQELKVQRRSTSAQTAPMISR